MTPWKKQQIFVGYVFLVVTCFCHVKGAPKIGVVTEYDPKAKDTYITPENRKFLEDAGAEVVPIHYDWDHSQIESVLRSVNGVLFQGMHGQVPEQLLPTQRYIVSLVKQLNDNQRYFPLWGTCLGFQHLCEIIADANVLEGGFDAEDVNLSLQFTADIKQSRMFANASDTLIQKLAHENITRNFHKYSVTPIAFKNHPSLPQFFKILSTSKDRHGREFVSTIEAHNYPIYGSQWHPELPSAGCKDCLTVSNYIGKFFISQASKN